MWYCRSVSSSLLFIYHASAPSPTGPELRPRSNNRGAMTDLGDGSDRNVTNHGEIQVADRRVTGRVNNDQRLADVSLEPSSSCVHTSIPLRRLICDIQVGDIKHRVILDKHQRTCTRSRSADQRFSFGRPSMLIMGYKGVNHRHGHCHTHIRGMYDVLKRLRVRE